MFQKRNFTCACFLDSKQCTYLCLYLFKLDALLIHVVFDLSTCESIQLYVHIYPRKSKSTKLCPLVGSGILYMDHPKDQPLCLVDWTSRDT